MPFLVVRLCLQLTQLLLHHLIGFDTVVMNWLVSVYGGHGYLYTMQSKVPHLTAHAQTGFRFFTFKPFDPR